MKKLTNYQRLTKMLDAGKVEYTEGSNKYFKWIVINDFVLTGCKTFEYIFTLDGNIFSIEF
jgi:hypothetical protein